MEPIENRLKFLREKLEQVGFLFESEQKPHLQSRKVEFKFIHPKLMKKFRMEGWSTRATKFYLKPLVDDASEIGFVTGKSSPLHKKKIFTLANTIDTFNDTPAWSNTNESKALDKLLISISRYLNSTKPIASQSLNTYLVTWNPTKWDWREIEDNIRDLESKGYFERRWSCGNSKNIKKGDRVFLIRLGEEPKGIMGSGYAKSTFYTAQHWGDSASKKANYIDIEFDILLNPKTDKLMDYDSLAHIDQNRIQQWTPQQSGISIKDEIVENLEASWFNFITENRYIGNSFLSNDVIAKETYYEGKSKEVTQTSYERNPRARKLCLDHYGYSCQICDFNFEEAFGEIGKGFIHVHHITPISEIGQEYEIEPLKDLIPVCPNCHAMIHSKRPAFGINEIKHIKTTASNMQ